VTPLNLDKLNRYRRADLEAIVYRGVPWQPWHVAGDIVLGSASVARSVRFSFLLEGNTWRVVLSAEGHTRCTDSDVAKFLKFARLTAIREHTHPDAKFVRGFDIEQRA
jgi:hypothetical protein